MKSILTATTAVSALLIAACSAPTEEAAPADVDAPEAATESEAPAPVVIEASFDAAALEAVLSDERRENDRARDQFRNPAATLEFFEVAPTHTVVEALPGGGWYSRVIAPYLADGGQYMGVNYSMDVFGQLFGDRLTDERRAQLEAWEESFPAQVEGWGGQSAGAFRFGGVPSEFEGQADRVLYIRALHNMARTGNLDVTATDAFALLKPGGMVGVVQHRAPADETDERADGNRAYLREADVIAAFEAVGFELAGSSDINANPSDTADYEIGVWALPPTNAGDTDEEDVAPLQSTGESDRMTLKFLKPE